MDVSPGARIFVGTAGWSLPRNAQVNFAGEGSHLERYAQKFPVAEINSTFHRSHRAATLERWASSVPADFQFAAKIPKIITHTLRLRETEAALVAFLAELSPLRERISCLLVQLPPSLEFSARVAGEFFRAIRALVSHRIVCEPRHPSWFEEEADALLRSHQVARAAADPARVPIAAEPGGCRALSYYRLHGSPKIYYSAYSPEYIGNLAARLRADATEGRDVWCIFDNTTLGAATGNALALREAIGAGEGRTR